MKAKQIICLCSTILIMSSFAGCSKDSKESNTTDVTITEAPTATPAATEAPTEVPTEEPTKAPTETPENTQEIGWSGAKPESTTQYAETKPYTGTVYLYGEFHGLQVMYDAQLEAWKDYYTNKGMRYMFVELPFHTAEFLNQWMVAENDDILNAIYEDIDGCPDHCQEWLDFYKTIKRDYPETIFKGFDIGHQYDTVGARYVKYLEDNNLQGEPIYQIEMEGIEAGKYYMQVDDPLNREDNMARNFMRELSQLGDQDVMAITGYYHSCLHSNLFPLDGACMGKQLYDQYGDQIQSVKLTYLLFGAESTSTKKVTIDGKEYVADLYPDNAGYREIYRIEDAYNDFKGASKNNNVLWWYDFPMMIEPGQVYLVQYEQDNTQISKVYMVEEDADADLASAIGIDVKVEKVE